MVDGKFTKAVPSPATNLKRDLFNAATTKEAVYRAIKGLMKTRRVRGTDPLSAILTGADIGQLMQKNLKINKSVSGRSGGRRALND